MPMVETSVAVATPSTTAARITNGSAAPAARRRSSRAISAPATRGVAAQVLACGSATRRRRRAPAPSTTAGSMPPVNSAAIETPVTEPIVISTMRRRNRLGLRAGRGEQRDQVAGLRAALLHLGEQHRRDRRHVGGLRAGDAGDEIHRADQHVRQAAAHVAEQAREELRPSRAPCRSSRSAGRGTRTAAPPAGSGATCPRPCRPDDHRAAAWSSSARDSRTSRARTRTRSARRRTRSRPTTPTKKIEQVRLAERPEHAGPATQNADARSAATATSAVAIWRACGSAGPAAAAPTSSHQRDADRQREPRARHC